MAEPQSFRLNTSNYLGLNHNTFKNKLLEIALTQPAQYFKIRENVLKNVKEKAISNMYDTFYNVMTKGTVEGPTGTQNAANDALNPIAGITVETMFVPNYPNQKVTEFALGAAKTLDSICDECIEIIMPLNYKDLAEARLARKGEADRLG